MRDRFLKGGLENFADHEALELLLFYALPRIDTNGVAHALMDRFGSLDAVFSASMNELQEIKGVGDSAAVLLRLTPLIAQRAGLARKGRDLILDSPEHIGPYVLELFSQERNETVFQLCLDRKYKLLACKRLGEGSASAVNLDIRKLVENALTTSSCYVILAHNHPSGVALPSRNDEAATDRARAALETIGVVLLDHLIVADGDYVSLADSGFFV